MPDLIETQRVLCESAAHSVANPTAKENDFKRLATLLTNAETHRNVIQVLAKPEITEALVQTLQNHTELHSSFVDVLKRLFIQHEGRIRAVDIGMFPPLVQYVAVGGAVSYHSLWIISSLIDAQQDVSDYLTQLSKQTDFMPFLSLLWSLGEPEPDVTDSDYIAARSLALVSMHKASQRIMATPPYTSGIASVIRRYVAKSAVKSRELILPAINQLVRALANISMDSVAQPLVKDIVKSDLIKLLRTLNHPWIAYETTRFQIYAGDGVNCPQRIIPTLASLAPKDADFDYLLLYNEPTSVPSDSPWAKIKATSLERLVEIITVPGYFVKHYFFTTFSFFFHPVALFRLLVDTFYATPFGTRTLPPEHMQIFELIKSWMKVSIKDFSEFQRDLKGFLSRLAGVGGMYKEQVDALLDSNIDAQTDPPIAVLYTQTDYSESAHQRLYDV